MKPRNTSSERSQGSLRRELANLRRRIVNHYPPNDIMGLALLERHQKELEAELAHLIHYQTKED